MIELSDVVYCRVGTQDLESAEAFATTILGLEVAERTKGAVHFKSDSRDHTLCYFEGNPEDHVTSFELKSSAELQTAAATLDALGHNVQYGSPAECEIRHVREFIRFNDPTGNVIEFIVRPSMSGVEYHGTRDAGITGFSHVGFYSTDVERDEKFWTTVCNARVSDRIGDAPLMRIGAIHHTIALFPGNKAGIQHINHQVESTHDIQRSSNLLRDKQVPITFGPGRHPTSSAQFLYFRGPDGMTYEYSSGVCEIHDEPLWRDRQFAFEPKGFCLWGASPKIAAFSEGDD